MIISPPGAKRDLKKVSLTCDLAVAGGGLAGMCCAITAARAGIKVVLIHDRPVLGGNASSEVRLWVLGATSHMGNNNRWAREGGLIDEILVENMWRNPEGNALILDTILLEKVTDEPNITLLLNASVFEAVKSDPETIGSLTAFCSQNSTLYEVKAPLFCDASGDGVVGFLSGAAFRMGAERREEFNEGLAPTEAYGELLGHSLYFFSKDTGRPVKFVPPRFALDDIASIPRYRQFNTHDQGCRLWWIEHGGRMDTVHDTETIKWELWRVVYGVWNYIKNSGQFPEAATMTLEWVGHIPGKRESRRFEGPYILRQEDVVAQRTHADAVAFGGWSLDLHPADGVFSELPGCNQWHARGIYEIPYRCLHSRNIRNLFIGGRLISASHVAFSSTRVMATCALGAQAIGMAAALCRRHDLLPAGLSDPIQMRELQRLLQRSGQYLPNHKLEDADDLALQAEISASTHLILAELPDDGPRLPLESAWAQMLPVAPGRVPRVTFTVDAAGPTQLHVELRTSDRPGNHTPDRILDSRTIPLEKGLAQAAVADFEADVDSARYVFFCFMPNPLVTMHCSEQRLSGILSVAKKTNPAVSNYGAQAAPKDSGVESFEFWTPQRRPLGHNLALKIDPGIDLFAPANVVNGVARATSAPNAWTADPGDPRPSLVLRWKQPQTIARLELGFDTDFDHPMESVLMGHPERAMPFCVKHYRVLDRTGRVVHEVTDNHQTRNTARWAEPLVTDRLTIECVESHGPVPATLFEVRVYGPE
jgi:hypothetical protein